MKIACIQLNSGDDVLANIAAIEKLVAKAARQGAEVVALPENAFYMADPKAKKRPSYTAKNHPGIAASAALAKLHNIWLLAGSVAVQEGKNTKSYNRSLLFNPQGKLAAEYDKIHLFDVQLPNGEVYAESERFAPGRKATLVKTPFGKIGLTVCYDLRFPHLFRALAKKGAQIIFVPSAFTQVTGEAHWHTLLRARAIENGCFIVAPAQTGTHPGGRKTYGHSLVVNPWGRVVADGGMIEGVTLASLDLAEVERVRKNLPSLSHDRPYKT